MNSIKWEFIVSLHSGMWEGKYYRESEIMSNWSERENFFKYDVKLQNEGLNAERCKCKMIELFYNNCRPHKASLFDEYYADHKYGGKNIEKCSYNKSQQDALFHKFILVKNSTCFGEIFCPSSGVLLRYSQKMVFVILVRLTVCWRCNLVSRQST